MKCTFLSLQPTRHIRPLLVALIGLSLACGQGANSGRSDGRSSSGSHGGPAGGSSGGSHGGGNGGMVGVDASASIGTDGPSTVSVLKVTARPESRTNGPIRQTDRVLITAEIGAVVPATGRAVEYYLDDFTGAVPSLTSVPMETAPTGWNAILPERAANSVVRYRIVDATGPTPQALSPTVGWHAYFVEPEISSDSRIYHLFISPKNWGQLWDVLQAGMAKGCTVNNDWNSYVPAVFVYASEVFDVRARYQGGYIHRTEGDTIANWPYPAPTSGPKPLRALGWEFKFGKDHLFEAWPGEFEKSLVLNKLAQSCPGVDHYVDTSLMQQAGIPSYRIRFVRLYVNGGYYDYAMELEERAEPMLKRFYGTQQTGALYKSNGTFGDLGPYGAGDEQILAPRCTFTSVERYAATYPLETSGAGGHADLVALVEGLNAARASGGATLAKFLEDAFDVEAVLTYMAVRNWAGAWDDDIHNHHLYHRPDGKWIITPTDFDNEFGGATGLDANANRTPTSSFYLGEKDNPENKLGWNAVKDSFFKAFRARFNQRLLNLNATVLAPANVLKLIDEGAAAFSLRDWSAAPGHACDVNARIERVRSWARARGMALPAALHQ